MKKLFKDLNLNNLYLVYYEAYFEDEEEEDSLIFSFRDNNNEMKFDMSIIFNYEMNTFDIEFSYFYIQNEVERIEATKIYQATINLISTHPAYKLIDNIEEWAINGGGYTDPLIIDFKPYQYLINPYNNETLKKDIEFILDGFHGNVGGRKREYILYGIEGKIIAEILSELNFCVILSMKDYHYVPFEIIIQSKNTITVDYSGFIMDSFLYLGIQFAEFSFYNGY